MFLLWKKKTEHEHRVVGPDAPATRQMRIMAKLPTCEFCLERSEYFGKTAVHGRSAYMCPGHFRRLAGAYTAPAQRLATV